MPKYFKNNLQQIFKVVVKSKISAKNYHKKFQKRLLKAEVSKVYKNKSYINCYNFPNSVKIILPCLVLKKTTKFLLPALFLQNKLCFDSINTNKSLKPKLWLFLSETISKLFFGTV